MARARDGFSKPKIARYTKNSDGTVSYSNYQPLAMGVSVDLSITTSDNVKFRADNVDAISAPAKFTGGTATFALTEPESEVDNFVFGLGTPDSDGGVNFDESMNPPDVGLGYIIRYLESDGTHTYRPIVLYKAKGVWDAEAAQTEGDSINMEATNYKFNLFRSDAAGHAWRYRGGFLESEEAAEAVLAAKLGGTTQQGGQTQQGGNTQEH